MVALEGSIEKASELMNSAREVPQGYPDAPTVDDLKRCSKEVIKARSSVLSCIPRDLN